MRYRLLYEAREQYGRVYWISSVPQWNNCVFYFSIRNVMYETEATAA